MHVILNDGPLEEVHCFKYLRSQVAADGGCGTQCISGLEHRERWKLVKVKVNYGQEPPSGSIINYLQ